MSEDVYLPDTHAPILAAYSTKDRLGSYYIDKTKAVATGLSQPCKLIVVDGKPHGHELVTDPECGPKVREEIKGWLAENL
jgi:hypothetical protein